MPALDLFTERTLQSEIDKYRSKKTTIIITYRLSTIQNADQIYVLMEDKSLKREHRKLMNQGFTYKTFVLQEGHV